MSTQEVLVQALTTSADMLKMTLADFSDADLLVRPLPNANHTAWQLGHLTVSEYHMLSAQGAKLPELPAGFEARYAKETSTSNDPAKFNTKAELLEVFAKVRAASIAFTQNASDAQLSAQTANEQMRDFAPTTAALINIFPSHVMMHVGQFQVIRRKLGKPILF